MLATRQLRPSFPSSTSAKATYAPLEALQSTPQDAASEIAELKRLVATLSTEKAHLQLSIEKQERTFEQRLRETNKVWEVRLQETTKAFEEKILAHVAALERQDNVSEIRLQEKETRLQEMKGYYEALLQEKVTALEKQEKVSEERLQEAKDTVSTWQKLFLEKFKSTTPE